MAALEELSRVELVLRALGIAYEPVEGSDTELRALCPFHHDTKPSWGIQKAGESAELHYCFSCKEGGNLLKLAMHVRGVGSFEADLWLLDVAGAGQPEEEVFAPALVQVESRKSKIGRPAFRMPDGFLPAPLSRWATKAREQMERRGIDEAQAKRWGMGYALDGKLRGRIVFPVRDGRGHLASYQARDFTGADDRPRYLTPSLKRERPNLDAMLGEHLWRDRGRVVVVEGGFKALAVERAGEANVAALGGSDLRDAVVRKLMRFSEVVVMTDPDAPGDKVASEMIVAIGEMTRACRVRRVRLEEGEEPDEVEESYLRRRLG